MGNDAISLNKPLPCPFCRNDLLEIKREGNDTFTWHQVWCPACGCKGPGGLSEENGIARWNICKRDAATVQQ